MFEARTNGTSSFKELRAILRVVKITLAMAAGKVCSVRLQIRCLIKEEKESSIKGTQRNTVFLSWPKMISLSPMGLHGPAVTVYEAERMTIGLRRGSKEGMIGRKELGGRQRLRSAIF